MISDLKTKNILISGQAYTSRTEMLEEYLKDKVKTQGVIALAGAFQSENVSHCRLYKDGKRISEFSLPAVLIKGYNRINRFLLFPVFIVYFFSSFWFFFRLKKRFDLFIGISHFSGFVGVILKKFFLVKKTIYYCIDYYPSMGGLNFENLMAKIQLFIDRLNVQYSDFVWNISPKISEARLRPKRTSLKNQNKQIIVPLCYSAALLCSKPFEEIERWTIGFVGALSRHQGLEILFRALPKISQSLPQVKVKIIGKGAFGSQLKEMASNLNLRDRVDFCGYLKEQEMKEVLSRCALGIAPWVPKKDNYFLYSDPGKIKLYAFCGLPIIMTKGPAVADEIERMKVGLAINYDLDEFINAVVGLLSDERLLKTYRDNALAFANKYTSENVFNIALERTFNFIYS